MSLNSLQRLLLAGALLVLASVGIRAQEAVITAPESIAADGVPKIPATLVETAGRYGAYRSASLADWNPVKREMLIATRFGDTPQLHLVSAPGGERHQLTFFPDAVTNGRFHPNGGDYIVFSKDIGGGEWYQLYRYDLKTWRCDFADRRQSAEPDGAVVVPRATRLPTCPHGGREKIRICG